VDGEGALPQTSFIYFNPPTTDWQWLILPLGGTLLSVLFCFLAHWAKKVG
jgi:hypothetical protein